MSDTYQQGETSGAPPRPPVIALITPGVLAAMTATGQGGVLFGWGGAYRDLWAVALGAFLMFLLTEGVARWQLATGMSMVQGWARYARRTVIGVGLLFFLPWSYYAGARVLNTAMLLAFETKKRLVEFGVIPSAGHPLAGPVVIGSLPVLAALLIILFGGWRRFVGVMLACAAVLVVSLFYCCLVVQPDWGAAAAGLFTPRVSSEWWTLQEVFHLVSAVGGVATILCYGYWIRQEGREGMPWLKICRVDLAVGSALAAVIAGAFVVLGAVAAERSGGRGLMGVMVWLEDEYLAGLVFLAGAWAAVFAGMLGLWQCVPHIFTDGVLSLWPVENQPLRELRRRVLYAVFLGLMVGAPYIFSLIGEFAVPHGGGFGRNVGMFLVTIAIHLEMPFVAVLAVSLLLLLGVRRRVDRDAANSMVTNVALGLAAAAFLAMFARMALHLLALLNYALH